MSKLRIVKLLDPLQNNVTVAGVTVQEEDGSPIVTHVTDIKVANGSLTNNGLNSVSIDYDSRYVNITGDTMSGELGTPSIQLDTDPTISDHSEGRMYWDSTDNTLALQTEIDGVTLQVGKEMFVDAINTSGVTINNGQAVYISGVSSNIPEITLAKADVPVKVTYVLGIATHDILDGARGHITTHGVVRDFDTSGLSIGPIYLSPTSDGGLTSVKPTFPNYIIQMGDCLVSSDSVGKILVNVIGRPIDIIENAFNGQFLEGFDFEITSDGSTITGSLQSKTNGDLTMNLSDGFNILDCTPALTIALTPGSATAPQTNFVYVLRSTKALTVSTSEWPTTEHIKIAEVVVLDATTTQTIGALRNQNWNDHLAEVNQMGHIMAMSERMRQEPSKWDSGVEGTITIVGASSPDDVYFANTSGVIYQMHKQTFPAYDMAAGDDIHIVNQPTTPYIIRNNLNLCTIDSSGSTLVGRHFSFVIWGIQNSGAEPSHIMLNLPTGSYTSSADAIADANNYSVYTVPKQFNGVGFLIGRYTFYLSAAGGGTWTLNNSQDLRGYFPNTAAGGSGGGGAGGVTSFTALTDTPSSYLTSAGKIVRVNAGATALEFVSAGVLNLEGGTANSTYGAVSPIDGGGA